jgi:hypothetical protein
MLPRLFQLSPPSSSWIVTAGDPCWFTSGVSGNRNPMLSIVNTDFLASLSAFSFAVFRQGCRSHLDPFLGDWRLRLFQGRVEQPAMWAIERLLERPQAGSSQPPFPPSSLTFKPTELF